MSLNWVRHQCFEHAEVRALQHVSQLITKLGEVSPVRTRSGRRIGAAQCRALAKAVVWCFDDMFPDRAVRPRTREAVLDFNSCEKLFRSAHAVRGTCFFRWRCESLVIGTWPRFHIRPSLMLASLRGVLRAGLAHEQRLVVCAWTWNYIRSVLTTSARSKHRSGGLRLRECLLRCVVAQ